MNYPTLQDRVVVITGASSGIGKLAVEEFLRAGSKVVLAARSEDAMRAHLNELGVGDDRAIVVRTEVADPRQIDFLAHRAVEHFHHIDVWVNNAAVSVYGPLTLMEPEEISRVVDVNLKGMLYGARAALKVFQNQHFGNLINISSIIGKVPSPLQVPYVATKHGIIGMTHALRQEVKEEGFPDIDVSLILPASIDTPLFQHARTKMGVKPRPCAPIYHPARVVEAILDCALTPQDERPVGGIAYTMVAGSRLSPKLTEWQLGVTGVQQQVTDQPEAVQSGVQDNLFEPMPNTQTVRGEYGTTGEHLADTVRHHPVETALAVGLPLFLGWTWITRRRAAAAELAVV